MISFEPPNMKMVGFYIFTMNTISKKYIECKTYVDYPRNLMCTLNISILILVPTFGNSGRSSNCTLFQICANDGFSIMKRLENQHPR